MISDLPRDLAEKVLSRLPVTSLRGVRSTCKKWNTISNNRSFTRRRIAEAKAAAKNKRRKEFQVVMVLDYRVYLLSVNLLYPSIERIGRLISLDDADRVDISHVFHCDGLLLCVAKDRSRLVVWNPWSGQTRWIQPRDSYKILDRYALGYERNSEYSLRGHKVLRFVDDYDSSVKRRICEFELYSLNSNSWKVVDVNPDWDVEYIRLGLSLKGNTYWFAQQKIPKAVPGRRNRDISDLPDFLLCFDFTAERFAPRLRLPFHAFYGDTVALSSVREKHLAVLFQKVNSPAYTVVGVVSRTSPAKLGPS